MQPRNLADQGKPEPGSLAIAGKLENGRKTARAAPGDAAPASMTLRTTFAVATQRDAPALAVALGVLDRLEPAPQHLIASERDRAPSSAQPL
jgi:hypothetical protein